MPPFFFSALPPHSTGTSMPTPLYIPHLPFPANFNSMADASSSLSSSPFLSATTLCHHPCGVVGYGSHQLCESRFEIVIQVKKKVYTYFRVEILKCQNLGQITVEFFAYRLSRPLRSPPFSIEIGTGRKEGNWKGVRGKNFTRKRGREGDRMEEEGKKGFCSPNTGSKDGANSTQTFSVAKKIQIPYIYKSIQYNIFFSFHDPVSKHIVCVSFI